ncbi:MAG: molybdopterin molybdotransferase MoeA, partial [Steroidobacteraceae bacterium]|nr:molybdopterin molybdotransferase MoeA [Steroidobacteraceae bacterium]
GIALRAAAVTALRREFIVQGRQAAGDPPMALASDDHCIETMTGAMLPTGCDAVVPVERIERRADRARVADGLVVASGMNVHRRGTDARQGALLLAAGTRLDSPAIAVAASAGMARVRVSAQPAIAVISTGNELVDPGEPIAPHQVRRSNVYAVCTALREHGWTRVVDDHVRDDLEQLRLRLRFHLETRDVLILSGGVSVGAYDLVPQALRDLGVREVFHSIEQRPGRPMWFGVGPGGQAVFGLPGNPVSTLVCLVRYVVPALDAAMGLAPREPPRLALGADIEIRHGLTSFVPVRLRRDEWAREWADPRPPNGSGDFTSLTATDGFVELPPGPNRYAKGFVANYWHW